jgi:hypothetical protein
MLLDPFEAAAGLLLVFVLPGLAWARAVFPEWRYTGPLGLTRVVETATLALLLSVSLTILAGFALTVPGAGGFQASWTDPVLEAVLAGLAVVGAFAAWGRGAFDREPPAAPALEAVPWSDPPRALNVELAGLRQEQRRIRTALRRRDLPAEERIRLESERSALEERSRELERRREGEIAG